MSDAARSEAPQSPYQLARAMADEGRSGPEIKQALLESGVDASSAVVLVEAVGVALPAEDLDLEEDMKTAVRAVKDVRQKLNRESVRKVSTHVKAFATESLRFEAGEEASDSQRLAKNAVVGGGVSVGGLATFVALYLAGVELLPAYVAAGAVAALGAAHFLYGISHAPK